MLETVQQKPNYPENDPDIYNQVDKLSTRRYHGKFAKRKTEHELLKEFLLTYLARQEMEDDMENNN